MRLNIKLTSHPGHYIHCSTCKDGSLANQLQGTLMQPSTNSYYRYVLWILTVVEAHPVMCILGLVHGHLEIDMRTIKFTASHDIDYLG